MGCNCKQRNTQPEVRVITPEPIPVPEVPVLTEEQMDTMTDEEKEHWDKLNNQ